MTAITNSHSVLPPLGNGTNGSGLLGPEAAKKSSSNRPSIANLTKTPSKSSIVVPTSRRQSDGETTPTSESNYSVYLQLQRASRSRLSIALPGDDSGSKLGLQKSLSFANSDSAAAATGTRLRSSDSSRLHRDLPYPKSYLACELDSDAISNSAIAALLHEQSAQVRCLDGAADALDDALIRVQDELNRTRTGADWQSDAIDKMGEREPEPDRIYSQQSGMSLSEYTSRSTFRQNYGDNFHSAFWMDPESMLFDHQDHLFNAADAGNPDLMILPYLAPLPDILHALPPAGPVVDSFPRSSSGRKGTDNHAAPPQLALSSLDPLTPPAARRQLRPISPFPHISSKSEPPSAHDFLSITPATITFTNYTPGSVSAAEIDLVNRSATSISVGLDPDSPVLHLSSTFNVSPKTNTRLAPGMRHTLQVLFRPDSLADYEAPLYVHVVPAPSGGGGFGRGSAASKLSAIINLCAKRPAPELVGWPEICAMPTCPVGSMVEKVMRVTNRGGKGVFHLHVNHQEGMGGQRLRITPSAFALDKDDSVEVRVQYTDPEIENSGIEDGKGDYPLILVPVTLTCDNGSTIQTTFTVQRVSPAPCIVFESPFEQGIVQFESYPGIQKAAWVSIHNPTLLPIQVTLGHVVIHSLSNHVEHLPTPPPAADDSLDSTCTTATLVTSKLSPTSPFTLSPSTLSIPATCTSRVRITYISPIPQSIAAAVHLSYGGASPLTLALQATTFPLALSLSPPTISVPGMLPVGHTHTTHVTLTNHTCTTQRVVLDWALDNVPEHIVSCRIIDSLTSAEPVPRSTRGAGARTGDGDGVCLKPGKPRTVSVVWKGLWPGLVVGKLWCEQRCVGNDSDDVGVQRWRQEVPVQMQVGPVESVVSVEAEGARGVVEFGNVALGAGETCRIKLRNVDAMRRNLYWDAQMVPMDRDAEHDAARSGRSAVFSFVPSQGQLPPGRETWVHVTCVPVRPLKQFRALVQVAISDKEPSVDHHHLPTVAHVHVPVSLSCSVPTLVVKKQELLVGTLWAGSMLATSAVMELENVSDVACGFKITAPPSENDEDGVEVVPCASWGSVPAGKTAEVQVLVRPMTRSQAGAFSAPIHVLTDAGSVLTDGEGSAAGGGNVVSLTVSGTIHHPLLHCETTSLDFGTLPLFGWTVQHVTLTNPTTLPLTFAADPRFTPAGPAWTASSSASGSMLDLVSGAGVPRFKSAATGGHIEDLKSVAKQAWDLALGQMPVGLLVVPPVGVIHGGESVSVGIWCIGTRQTIGAFEDVVDIRVGGHASTWVTGNSGVQIACKVHINGSPLHLETPHLDPNTHVIHTGRRTSIPLHVTNLAPYPVKSYWGLLVWQASKGMVKSIVRAESAGKSARFDHPRLALGAGGQVTELEIPGQKSRVIHIAHDPVEADADGNLHGVLVHDLEIGIGDQQAEPWIRESWRHVVARVNEEQMQRPGVREGVVPVSSVFVKRAMLGWAKEHEAQSVYVATGAGGGASHGGGNGESEEM